MLVGDRERILAPGEVLDVPRGTGHAMVALGDGTRAAWQTRPALRTREYFAGMDAALARGGSVLDHAPVFRAPSAGVRLVGRGIQAPLLAVLAVIGRAVRRPYRGAP